MGEARASFPQVLGDFTAGCLPHFQKQMTCEACDDQRLTQGNFSVNWEVGTAFLQERRLPLVWLAVMFFSKKIARCSSVSSL